MNENDLPQKIIGAAIEVHKHLGPGLLESAYSHCIARELSLQGLSYINEVPLNLDTKVKILMLGIGWIF